MRQKGKGLVSLTRGGRRRNLAGEDGVESPPFVRDEEEEAESYIPGFLIQNWCRTIETISL